MRRCLPAVVLALLVFVPAAALAQADWCPAGQRWWYIPWYLPPFFSFCAPPAGYVPEPGTDVANLPSPAQPAAQSVRGIADIHMHQFANLGFGGAVFWGSPYDPRGINRALAWCDYTWDFPTTGNTPFYTPGFLVHGPRDFQWLTHLVSNGIDESYHDVGFDGWPTYKTMTHQQMYYTWLKRAYEGGVRLTVMLAVSNEAMCRASRKRADWGPTVCDDMSSVDRQLAAARRLEYEIDRQDNGAVDGSGWYRIATSPSQAREIIRDGAMAVVLGIEVDSLFGCKPGQCTDRAWVQSQIDHYYRLGVRHIYPIHQFNNAFGGAAIFNNVLNTGNAVVTGSHFQVRDCYEQGYRYNVMGEFWISLFAALLEGVGFPDPAYYNQFDADCNTLGLSNPAGENLIQDLMDRHFIIDVDHMSRLMLDRVLDIADARTPKYPLVSGHTDFFEKASPASEFTLTEAQIERIRDNGGIITATTVPHNADPCYSSREWVSYYEYAIDQMSFGPYGEGYEGVAFSTDFNGWGKQPGPRKRSGCPSDTTPDLQYPFAGLFGGSFYQQITGHSFNFNDMGLAHVGLVPDFLADVKASGRLTDDDLEPLYNSAETYIRMWERIAPPPWITPKLEGTIGANGWYTSDVTLAWTVTGTAGDPVLTTSGCGPVTIGTDTSGITYTCQASTALESVSSSVTIRRDTTAPTGSFHHAMARVEQCEQDDEQCDDVIETLLDPSNQWTQHNIVAVFVGSDGTSGIDSADVLQVLLEQEGRNQTATITISDMAGNRTVLSQGGFNIDRTPPEIDASIAPAPNGAGWHNGDVTVTFSAHDTWSGVSGEATAAVTLAAEGTNLGATRTFTDLAGNEASLTVTGVNLDKTAPGISFVSRLPEANVHGWNNAAVTVTWACSDALSGAVDATVSDTRSGEGEAQTATGTCRDVADNTASATRDGISIDLTKPVIAWTIEPPANEAGWHNTDVTLTFTATDALSGIDGTPTSVFVFTTDNANHGGAAAFTDKAGNASSLAKDGIRLDKTPPSIACLAAPAVLWPVNHKLVPVEVAFTFSDALSQVAAWSLITATSSEPDAGMGKDDAPGDIVGFPLGSMSLAGSLRAERTGQANQRTYTLGYRGFDVAGNASDCITTVVVPHDQKK